MTIRLDHTIVPSKDKAGSARFFAEMLGLTVMPGSGYFAQVRVNESLTFDFAGEPDPFPVLPLRLPRQRRGVRRHLRPREDQGNRVRQRARPPHEPPDQYPPGRPRLLLRGPQRPPARGHDGARDGKLRPVGYQRWRIFW